MQKENKMGYLLKQTDEIRANSEEEAKIIMENFRKEAEEKGYIIGASGYTYKTKKAKGEIIDEAWVVKIVKQLKGVWDEWCN